MEDANIMKARKYVKGYEQMDLRADENTENNLYDINPIGPEREVIGDFVQVQTMVDYDTEHFKYTDFNDPLYMYQDPLFPTFDIILDTEYSPLLSNRQGISSIQSFLNDYSSISSIGTRQKIYNEFKNTLYKLFNSGFKDIDRNKSYYINSISGLDKLTAKIVDFEKDNITITMNEDVSMITTYLSQLYNNLSYSYKDQRYMFPANLLRFNMYIKIHDVRNMVNIIPKYKPFDSNFSGETYTTSFDKSYQIYYLQDCTFNFFKSKFFEDNITVGGFDASISTTVASIKMDITYKSISIESGFPLIKNAITDIKSSAFILQNKAQSLESSLSNNQVFINNEKTVETFRDEIEQLKSPSLNSNDPSNNNGSNVDEDFSALKTYYELKNSSRTFEMMNMTGVGLEYDINQSYKGNILSPGKLDRPYMGDVQVSPGFEPRWYYSDTSAPEISEMKQSILNQINIGGGLQILPFVIIDLFMGGYHGMQDGSFISGYSSDFIYAPRGAKNYNNGDIFNPQELNGDTISDLDIQNNLNKLNQEIIPNYPTGGQLLSDPNVLSGEIIPIDPTVIDPYLLDGDVIPGSIILPGGVFSDPTVLDGENLNYQIPLDIFLDGLFIPMNWHVNAPLEGSIQMDWNEKDPLEGSIQMDWNEKDPLEGIIEMSYNVKDPLEGFIEMSYDVKDLLEGFIDINIKPKLEIEGRISQDIKVKEPLDAKIDNSFDEREFLNLIKPEYDIFIKSPLSGFIDQTIKEKPDFNKVILYEYPEFKRDIDMGSLYLNITKENIIPIVYLYSKTDKFKTLVDYYLYNKVFSEAKNPNASIVQTIKEKTPLNLIYSYNNELNIYKTIENVRLYNNEVNKVNNMIVNYVFEEYPIKYAIEEVRLYNNTIIPALMPEIYLYNKQEQNNYLINDTVYQMTINEFGNNIPNGLSIDTSMKEKTFTNLGKITENVPEKKETILPMLYEPSRIKKLLEPVLLYAPVEKIKFEKIDKLYENEEYIGNIFKSKLLMKETDFEEFGKRLDDVKIEQNKIMLKNFPYTTMSYKPILEVENENKRDKTLDKEKLDSLIAYKKSLKEEYITIKPIMDKDSEMVFKLEGNKINTERRERTNKEEYEHNISSLNDEDRLVKKKIVDEYEPLKRSLEVVKIDQTITYKAPFKESYIDKSEDVPVPENDSTLEGQRINIDIKEEDSEKMGNVFDDEIETKDRKYLVNNETLDYNSEPRKVLATEQLDTQIKKKENLNGDSINKNI
jgi:hypothetical protein